MLKAIKKKFSSRFGTKSYSSQDQRSSSSDSETARQPNSLKKQVGDRNLLTDLDALVIAISKADLPGGFSFDKMVPTAPDGSAFQRNFSTEKAITGFKSCAVLFLFYLKNNKVHFVLTRRQSYNGTFSGQICLPGGKAEESDADLAATAKRESFEEIGVMAEEVETFQEMTTLSQMKFKLCVTPFLGVFQGNGVPDFIRDEREVAEIIDVPLEELLDEGNFHQEDGVNAMGSVHPCFRFGKNEVWGITGCFLSELKDLLLQNIFM
eukprot:snap_masked-scaffold_14-processed-gene-4.32-mRNA-1 protein AED:1.00 eAED:1.00 QI:0/0/0/0/1/1/2/0/264